jgi:hypothetical protein
MKSLLRQEPSYSFPQLRRFRRNTEFQPDVARAFVKDMRAYFAEENPIKRDGSLGIPGTARQRLRDLKAMFLNMKDHI